MLTNVMNDAKTVTVISTVRSPQDDNRSLRLALTDYVVLLCDHI